MDILLTVFATIVGTTILLVISWRLVKSLSSLGEHDTYTVHGPARLTDASNTVESKRAGIPFFLKRRYYVRKAVFIEPLAIVELTLTRLDGPSPVVFFEGRRVVRWTPDVSQVVSELLAKGKRLGDAAAETVTNSFRLLPEWRLTDETRPEHVAGVADQIHSYVDIDYKSCYYINAQRPVLGASQATVKLNEHGLLAEASAGMDTSAVGSLLEEAQDKLFGNLPFNKLIDGKGTTEAVDSKRTPEANIAMELSVEHLARKHTLTTAPLITEPEKNEPFAFDGKAVRRESVFVRDPLVAASAVGSADAGARLARSTADRDSRVVTVEVEPCTGGAQLRIAKKEHQLTCKNGAWRGEWELDVVWPLKLEFSAQSPEDKQAFQMSVVARHPTHASKDKKETFRGRGKNGTVAIEAELA